MLKFSTVVGCQRIPASPSASINEALGEAGIRSGRSDSQRRIEYSQQNIVLNSFVRKRAGFSPSCNKHESTSDIGNNASSGLGGEATYGKPDMRYFGSEDSETRPTEIPEVETSAPSGIPSRY